MKQSGYEWTLKQSSDGWRWAAIGRDSREVLVQGVARSRAEAAACLALHMSLGVLGQDEALAA